MIRRLIKNFFVDILHCVLVAIAVGSPLLLIAHPWTATAATANGSTLNTHAVMVDDTDKIVSWVSNQDRAYDTVVSLAWDYLLNKVPNDPSTGQPAYFSQSYLNPDTQQMAGWPNNPAGMFSMLIESAMSYYQYSGNYAVITLAQRLADQELTSGMTLSNDNWPNVQYASGDAGSLTYHGASYGDSTGVGDGVGIIEPDKVGEFGIALIKLYEQTGKTAYRDAAIKDADALANHVRAGSSSQSPWPFRVNAQTGAIREQYSAHVISPIELFDELIRLNLGNVANYQRARTTAWNWMMTYPMINNAWSGYFEDVSVQGDTSNTNQLNAMMTARYLLRNPQTDPNWETHVRGLISWVESTFGVSQFGAFTIEEQQIFMFAMGSHTSRYAEVNALLYEKTGDVSAKEKAYRSFNWATYMARSTGVVIDGPSVNNQWFTDGYGDYIRHFMIGMGASPDWTPIGQTHLLESSSVVSNITYTSSQITYTTFDPSGIEEIEVASVPIGVTANGAPLPKRSDLAGQGWTITQNVLRIRHDSSGIIMIEFNGVPINQNPSITLISPLNNATATSPGSFLLQATASDPDGTVNRVEFYSNGFLVATVASPPYIYTLSSLAEGTYSLSARAFDNLNAYSILATALVTVSNPSSTSTSPPVYETVWNTTTPSKSTSSFNVQAGDLLVATAMTEDSSVSVSISGGALNWIQQQVVSVPSYGWVSIWTAAVDANKTMSITFTREGGTGNYGGNIFAFRNAIIGASSNTNGFGSSTLNFTTTQTNSAIVVANVDWNAVSGSSRVWRTNAGAFTEKSYANVSGAYSIYGGFHQNAGASGTYAVGLSAPDGEKYSIAAVEVKGTASAVNTAPPIISGVTTGSINQNGASIIWTTNAPATSRVEYGLSTNYSNTTAVNSSLDTTHTQVVAGLSAGTLYHFRIHSIDAAGNEGISSDFTFATPMQSDTKFLFGDQEIESQVDYNALGSAEAFQTTAISSGTVRAISVYVDGSSTARTLIAGIYADSAGHPGPLITQGSSAALTASAWNAVTIPGASVTEGQPYWIAVLGINSGQLSFRDGSGGCKSEVSAQSDLTALPLSWMTGAIYPSCPLSAYGSIGP
ncbi:Ig-like domain-containing protein [Methylocapsa palsarum]|uniref:Fibronectin type-III domain-containing protein n=1 Tax=Methylocapsa palsarum TaxID=1612308 RepID=A0A1I4BM19_9HYPH|nr:Ig-like domain-containing protein [Methylocapsa palsarum]SFK69603.1 hypothetical protein SAMN05444581_11588 [Methylocapsa palsarum]